MDFLTANHAIAMQMVLMVLIVTFMEFALANPMQQVTSATNAKQDTPTSLLVTNVMLVTLNILIVSHVLVMKEAARI